MKTIIIIIIIIIIVVMMNNCNAIKKKKTKQNDKSHIVKGAKWYKKHLLHTLTAL